MFPNQCPLVDIMSVSGKMHISPGHKNSRRFVHSGTCFRSKNIFQSLSKPSSISTLILEGQSTNCLAHPDFQSSASLFNLPLCFYEDLATGTLQMKTPNSGLVVKIRQAERPTSWDWTKVLHFKKNLHYRLYQLLGLNFIRPSLFSSLMASNFPALPLCH